MNNPWPDIIKTSLTLVPLSLISSWFSKHGKFSATVTKPNTFYNTFSQYKFLIKALYGFLGILFYIFSAFFIYSMFYFLNNNQTIGYLISAVACLSFFILGEFFITKPYKSKLFTTFVLNDEKYFIIGDREVDNFYLCKTEDQFYKLNFPKEFKKIEKNKVNIFSQESVNSKSFKKYNNNKKACKCKLERR